MAIASSECLAINKILVAAELYEQPLDTAAIAGTRFSLMVQEIGSLPFWIYRGGSSSVWVQPMFNDRERVMAAVGGLMGSILMNGFVVARFEDNRQLNLIL
jgi:hypothetical protein